MPAAPHFKPSASACSKRQRDSPVGDEGQPGRDPHIVHAAQSTGGDNLQSIEELEKPTYDEQGCRDAHGRGSVMNHAAILDPPKRKAIIAVPMKAIA
jgi:hypothetical protein